MLGEKLNYNNYDEVVNGTILSLLTLDEVIDVAMNGEGMNQGLKYLFAGAYFQYNTSAGPTIIIDRELSVGGFKIGELKLLATADKLSSNDKLFSKLVYDKIVEKSNKKDL